MTRKAEGPGAGNRRLRRLALAAFAVVVAGTISANAATGGIARDAETEALIQDYARPLFKAAGVRATGVHIFIIIDDSFNAFVANSSQMFINTGAIIQAKTPNEIIGVIAHETGHLAHNDLAALRQQMADIGNAALAASLVGLGAAIAGSSAGINGLGDVGAAVAMGSNQIAQRTILSYRRAQESAADRAAITFLDKTGQSGAGLLAILKRLSNDMLLNSRDLDPYLQSHPLPAERLTDLQTLVDKSPNVAHTDPPALQRRQDLVRAKLIGFTWQADRVLRQYPMSDQSLPARYARAISAYRSGAGTSALKQIDGLIASDSADPYFYELKGQVLLESGKAAPAIDPLRRAVGLAPNASLIRVLYGQALVAAGGGANLTEAVKTLSVALQADPNIPFGFEALARAYGLQNNIPMAELATAQGLFAGGNFKDAKMHARRAQANLKLGTPAWLRADDIVSYKPLPAAVHPAN